MAWYEHRISSACAYHERVCGLHTLLRRSVSPSYMAGTCRGVREQRHIDALTSDRRGGAHTCCWTCPVSCRCSTHYAVAASLCNFLRSTHLCFLMFALFARYRLFAHAGGHISRILIDIASRRHQLFALNRLNGRYLSRRSRMAASVLYAARIRQRAAGYYGVA